MQSKCFRGVGRSVLLSLVACLTACGGGGSGGSSAPSGGTTTPTPTPALASADEYFPLNSGDRRAYLAGTDDTTMVSVIGTDNLPSGPGLGLRVRSTRVDGFAEEIYQRDASGVRTFPVVPVDPLITAIGSLLVMKPTFTAGDRWIVADATVSNLLDLDDDRVNDVITVRIDATVVGMESLTVGPNNFTRVAHIQTVGTRSKKLSRTGTTAVTTVTSDDWYAPGIGLVRSRVTTADGGSAPITRISELTSWRVGTQRSDSRVPLIESRSPFAGSINSGCCVYVNVYFDRAMDTSATAEPIKLFGPDGLPVAGTPVWDRDTKLVSFAPSKRLTSGTYTARVSAANRDVAGNSLPADVTWQFVVDASGPAITPVQPLPNAQNVAVDSKIVFNVEADTDLSQLSLANVQVGYFSSINDLEMSVSGQTVTLTPKRALPRGDRVRVKLINVPDKIGNTSSFDWAFDTDPGRFAAPEALTATIVTATAIGDVNGDGRNDVVLAVIPETIGAVPKVQVLFGQAGGTFEPARTYATAAEHDRSITSLALVDVDRNGQLAIVVGNQLHGLQVLRRQPDGQFAVSQVIDTDSAYLLRVADFNGDGRPDLIGRSYDGTEVQIWLLGADGRYAAGRTVVLPADGVSTGFAVGDLNGDGRLDFAVSNARPGKEFAVLYQQADGSFASPIYLNVPYGLWGQGVAIGDVNGDGRQDLIGSGASAHPVTVFLQDVNGQLLAGVAQAGADGATRVNLADIDGDGRLDIVASGAGWPLTVTLQRSDGSLGASQWFPVMQTSDGYSEIVSIGDLDGDGRPDILYGGFWLRQRVLPGPVSSKAHVADSAGLGLGRLLGRR